MDPLVAADWIPEVSPSLRVDPAFLIALMLLGFVVGILGHLTRTRTAVALGIGMIFLATFVLPLAANIAD